MQQHMMVKLALVFVLAAGAFAEPPAQVTEQSGDGSAAAPPAHRKEPLLDRVVQFLEEDDWKYQRFEDMPLLRTAFQGENGNWNVAVQSNEAYEQVYVYSVWTNNVPEERRMAVAEYLTRANYGLTIGSFEMDLADGEVRYRTSVDVEGGELAPVMVKNLLYLNVFMFDKYLPGLNKVVFGGMPPADAVAEAEKAAQQRPGPAKPEAPASEPADK